MSSPVISLFEELTLPLAEDIMRYKHLHHLPVVDDNGRLVGLVSHRDLLSAQISSLAGLTAEQRRYWQQNVRVGQLMTRDIWTVKPDTPASCAGKLLREHPFGCLPVVDDRGIVIGILTERDFLEYATNEIEATD